MLNEIQQRKLETAISFVETLLPNAVSVLAAMDVRLDERVETAAVSPSGRMIVSPAFVEKLPVKHLAFVVAHELYHVLYGVFSRFDENTSPERHWLINIAHDLIINDMLAKKFCEDACEEWGNPFKADPESVDYDIVCSVAGIPRDGLFWQDFQSRYEKHFGRPQPPIDSYTLESLVLELEQMKEKLPKKGMLELILDTASGNVTPENGLGAALDALGLFPVQNATAEAIPELVADSMEATLFPGESAIERAVRAERIARTAELATARNILGNQLATRGGGPGCGNYLVQSLDGYWNTPWERVLQKWLDGVTHSSRSWAKASRRAGDRADVVLPGRMRDGHILHIVADTSGSMGSLLPGVFGLVKSFGKNAGVDFAHIVQCDTEVVADEIVDIDDLDTVQVKGLGGGMEPPGMLLMAEDATIESVLVITDGYIDAPPREAIPYEVLWCLLCRGGDTSHFAPGYGIVTSIPAEELLNK